MEGALDMGHARALAGARSRAPDRGRAPRRRERPVGARGRGPGAIERARQGVPKDAPRRDRDLERLEDELSASLGTTVEIRAAKKGSGKLLVHYSSLDHLEELLKKLR